MVFLKSYIYLPWVVLPSFALVCLILFCFTFSRILCLKDPQTCTCIWIKLLHYYLFRVKKRKKKKQNTCLGCAIPLPTVQGSKFHSGKYVFRVLFSESIDKPDTPTPSCHFECPREMIGLFWYANNCKSTMRP